MKAFFKLSYGLYVVSSSFDGKQSACVVNTLSQVTAEPAKLSVAINKNNFTEKTIEKSGYFCAVVLAESATLETIGNFGFKSSENNDKFEKFNVEKDINGINYITDNVVAVFSCKVISKLDLDTHIMFIGEVIDAKTIKDEDPMTYSYYHKVKNGKTPKNAPSYQPEEKTESKKGGYRCTVCGYIHESDEFPEDFKCPVCGMPKEKFVKI